MFKKKKTKLTLKKCIPYFTTIDGVEHKGIESGWYDDKQINVTIGRYRMIDIKSDGFICDENGVQYILYNIIKVEWFLYDTIEVVNPNRQRSCNIYYTDREVDMLEMWEGVD